MRTANRLMNERSLAGGSSRGRCGADARASAVRYGFVWRARPVARVRYCNPLMPTRARASGHGTVNFPGHALHGAKVDIVRKVPGGDVIVRMRENHDGTYDARALARVRADRVQLEHS